MKSRLVLFHKGGARILLAAAFTLGLICVGCGTHDASDPAYGEMFKKTTRDRVQGTEFWGSRTQKDCTPGAGMGGEVCMPSGTSESSD